MNSTLRIPNSAFPMARLRQSILQRAFRGELVATLDDG